MLVFLDSSSAVLVIISSKSVSIRNRFDDKLVYNSSMMHFFGVSSVMGHALCVSIMRSGRKGLIQLAIATRQSSINSVRNCQLIFHTLITLQYVDATLGTLFSIGLYVYSDGCSYCTASKHNESIRA